MAVTIDEIDKIRAARQILDEFMFHSELDIHSDLMSMTSRNWDNYIAALKAALAKAREQEQQQIEPINYCE